MVSGMRRSLGAVVLVLFVVCSGAAAAVGPATHPFVKVNLVSGYTPAQRLAIQRRLDRNPNVRSVELLTRTRQLATARRIYKSILPADDVGAALRALQLRTKNDVLCVRVVSNAAADRLFATYRVGQRGVASITKFSGGEMLSDCNPVGGLEHTRTTVTVQPPSDR
jgi:hypothetical protein